MKKTYIINCEKFYLDYFNNYLTVKCIAEHYEISEEVAKEIIEEGRRLNHKR